MRKSRRRTRKVGGMLGWLWGSKPAAAQAPNQGTSRLNSVGTPNPGGLVVPSITTGQQSSGNNKEQGQGQSANAKSGGTRRKRKSIRRKKRFV